MADMDILFHLNPVKAPSSQKKMKRKKFGANCRRVVEEDLKVDVDDDDNAPLS